jgi:hypothetical protein
MAQERHTGSLHAPSSAAHAGSVRRAAHAVRSLHAHARAVRVREREGTGLRFSCRAVTACRSPVPPTTATSVPAGAAAHDTP